MLQSNQKTISDCPFINWQRDIENHIDYGVRRGLMIGEGRDGRVL